jgi:hypothetical protein
MPDSVEKTRAGLLRQSGAIDGNLDQMNKELPELATTTEENGAMI